MQSKNLINFSDSEEDLIQDKISRHFSHWMTDKRIYEGEALAKTKKDIKSKHSKG